MVGKTHTICSYYTCTIIMDSMMLEMVQQVVINQLILSLQGLVRPYSPVAFV